MDVKTYRASSLQAALSLVRSDLGAEAAVLRTREVSAGLLGWLGKSRIIEVTASASVRVPSRFRQPTSSPAIAEPAPSLPARKCFARPVDQAALGIDLETAGPPRREADAHARFGSPPAPTSEPQVIGYSDAPANESDGFSPLFAELLQAGVNPRLARDLLDRARGEAGPERWQSPTLLKHKLVQTLAREFQIIGPIEFEPGRRRLVALVGPTGVGKTTTIAKLAANFHLRQGLRVGLITVDTYRIAAVEQLGAYAEIMDLPMEVVSNPAELREAVTRFADLDLVLLDTAGRSPRDEEQIHELERLLEAAAPDEVHLVISGTASLASLEPTVARFAQAGATAMILTKLDEAHALGSLLALMRPGRLPLSYLTTGQQVPDDIAAVDAGNLARRMLGFV